MQRQEKRIRERAAAEAKAQEQARYAEAKNADEQYWDESAQQWAWTSTQYDAAGYEQSQYDTTGYEQSQFASQQPYDQSQFTYDEATQYHASQYEGGYDQSQYGAAAGFEQSFYTAPQHAGPEQSQYQSVYTAGPEQSQYDTEFQSADYDPSTEHRLSTRGESRMSTYTEEPQSVELGPRCPDAYHGYFDTVRQEPYAYDEATGECVYAIDKDGANVRFDQPGFNVEYVATPVARRATPRPASPRTTHASADRPAAGGARLLGRPARGHAGTAQAAPRQGVRQEPHAPRGRIQHVEERMPGV